MSYVYVGSPWPGDTVDRTNPFPVNGSADAGGADANILVKILDSGGALLAATGGLVAAGSMLAWGFTFAANTITDDYPNCTIVVELQPAGSDPSAPPCSESVTGVSLVQQGGGGLTGMP